MEQVLLNKKNPETDGYGGYKSLISKNWDRRPNEN